MRMWLTFIFICKGVTDWEVHFGANVLHKLGCRPCANAFNLCQEPKKKICHIFGNCFVQIRVTRAVKQVCGIWLIFIQYIFSLITCVQPHYLMHFIHLIRNISDCYVLCTLKWKIFMFSRMMSVATPPRTMQQCRYFWNNFYNIEVRCCGMFRGLKWTLTHSGSPPGLLAVV